jgi:cyclopropane fatty-acyl-phospholipid synthase-like methyltransferase
MSARISQRLSWAVEQLDVQPGERILEIGCGRGVAAQLVCERLGGGHLTAIDRSAAAIAAAEERNREHVRAGRATFLQAALADASLGGPFDRVFAANVNVFWLGPRRELEVIRRALARDGRLYLFYEPPSAAQLERAVEGCTAYLQEGGFTVERVLRAEPSPHPGVGIVAAPA